MRPDPPAGKSSHPQSLNRYVYTANDPVNLADPSGLNLQIPGFCGAQYSCCDVVAIRAFGVVASVAKWLSTTRASVECRQASLKDYRITSDGCGTLITRWQLIARAHRQIVCNRYAFHTHNNSQLAEDLIHEMFHAAGLHASESVGFWHPTDLPQIPWSEIQKHCAGRVK